MRTLLDWGATIVFAIAFVLVFEAELAKPYRIPSASMEPTLRCARPASGCTAGFSDRILADRLTYRFRDPRRGEIVVFTAPAQARLDCEGGGTFVKRVIGLPGDTVAERRGVVYIDGKPLREPYVAASDRDSRTQSFGRVPAHSYFVMGDNRANSCDSRAWGAVPRGSILGRAILTYWPLERIGVP